jgi:hypothetical protein
VVADVAQTAAQGPEGRASWRSGLGCAATLLSVAALVTVGQIAGCLAHRHGAQTPDAGQLAAQLDALPPADQAVPGTPGGVSRLLAAARLPAGTRTEVAVHPGDVVLVLGDAGDCVYVDVHAGRLFAWPAPMLAPCTAAGAYRAVLAGRQRPAAPPSGPDALQPRPPSGPRPLQDQA